MPVVEVLRRHRASSPHAFVKDGAIFTSSTGTPLDGTNVLYRFQARIRAAGLQAMRFHDLRHRAASLLLSDGADLFTVNGSLLTGVMSRHRGQSAVRAPA
jgi:site-specific recombinase XerD